MRSLFLVGLSALTLAACASSAPAPEKAAASMPAPAVAAAPAPAKKAPQCYSGDHGKFFDLGARTSISGVDVVCQATSDGKGGQWMGAKAKH
ncbi:hypothetical protein [Quatrionicoccus australiensis]|uniref:hypothetical protein n=1 Tax=Quatrionicoccus australiensis TaxID=138118 RepID=UPI001CF8D3B7|nr:hypothetical protein [Quatrionicoccus australiensis]UCV15825.1 hypothetical protein KI612_03720 [Quatrionicoccus australiensis]